MPCMIVKELNHTDSSVDDEWPQPHISRVIQGVVRIPNLSDKPVLIDKAQHFAYIWCDSSR